MFQDNWQPPEEPPAPRSGASYRADAIRDGVLSPVLKSLFIGAAAGILAGLLAAAFGWPATWSPWLTGLIVAFAVVVLSFTRYSERATWLIERITGADLNLDGAIGQPAPTPALPAPAPMRFIVDQPNERDVIDLPESVTSEQFALFARGILGGRSFAEDVWAGPSGVFSKPAYKKLREQLVAGGLVRWNNEAAHAQGATLTRAGKHVFQKVTGAGESRHD